MTKSKTEASVSRVAQALRSGQRILVTAHPNPDGDAVGCMCAALLSLEKLEKDVVMKRMKQLEDGGVTFVLNCNVGEDISFDEIRKKHNAVLIATGVYKSRDLRGPGSGAKGIVRAIDYLTASNRKGFGDEVADYDSGELNAEGKRVVVIGGGDTAMDCVRTAIRQGAESVKCLYRRDRANMPGSQREVANAEEEGVEFVWLSAPKGFTGDEVEGVIVQKMRLGAPDATGRQAPELIEHLIQFATTEGSSPDALDELERLAEVAEDEAGLQSAVIAEAPAGVLGQRLANGLEVRDRDAGRAARAGGPDRPRGAAGGSSAGGGSHAVRVAQPAVPGHAHGRPRAVGAAVSGRVGHGGVRGRTRRTAARPGPAGRRRRGSRRGPARRPARPARAVSRRPA